MNMFSEQSVGRLSGVDPRLAEILALARRKSGLNFEITEGMRTPERQKGLVSSGASQTMNSRHLHGNAVDVHLLNDDGTANWDFEAYRPVAAAMKGAAAELGYDDLVWGGDWKTLKDGVHFQVGGAQPHHSQPDVSGSGGNAGLLGGLSINPQRGQDTLASTDKPRGGLLGGPDAKIRQAGGLLGEGGFLSPDRRDRAIIALQGMTLNPNQAMQQAAMDNIAARRGDRATEKQRNATGEFLRSRGREDLAAAVESGAIPASAAVQEALKGQAVQKGVEINGQLVNPVTGERMGDYRTPEANETVGQVTGSQLIEKYGVEAGTIDPNSLFNVSPDGKVSAIGGAGTTINMPGQPQVGTIQPGWQLERDKDSGAFRMTPIPGGPADTAAKEAVIADTNKATQGEIKSSVVDDQIDTALKIMERRGVLDLPEAGIVGNALGAMGINQEAVDLKNTIIGIQATVAFDTLQKMREASKSGGALGSVSERELDLLISAYGALQQSTSKELLSSNLKTVKRIMGKIANDPVASKYIANDEANSADNGGFVIRGRVD